MSNEAKFTKGEWKVHSVGSQFSVGPLSSVDDQSNGMMNVVAWIEKFDYFTEEQSEYNAHIIAAAPEMYEMLERITANYQEAASVAEHEGYETKYAQDKIFVDELLAKARGE